MIMWGVWDYLIRRFVRGVEFQSRIAAIEWIYDNLYPSVQFGALEI